MAFFRKNILLGQLLLVLSVGLFLNQAKAIFFVEPLASYDSGTITATDLAGDDLGGKTTGFSYGARLGYHFSNAFFLAAEYLGASDTFKPNAGGASSTATGTAVSAIAGFHVNRFRFLVGYSPSDAYTLKSSSGTTNSKYTGTDAKVGVGLWLHRHITLEVDYVVPTYNKVDTGTGAVSTSSLYSKFDTNVIRAGLTFPFFF